MVKANHSFGYQEWSAEVTSLPYSTVQTLELALSFRVIIGMTLEYCVLEVCTQRQIECKRLDQYRKVLSECPYWLITTRNCIL